jgi:hypothetical protein
MEFEPRLSLVGAGRLSKVVPQGAGMYLLSTGKPGSWNFALCFDAFLLEDCQFQLTTSFSRVVECFLFTRKCSCCLPHTGWVSSAFHKPPRQR